MKVPEVQKHFLALMDRPGDYVFIDISKLDIANGYQPETLMELDTFTMSFTKDEIIAAVKRANIAGQKFINGSLVIQDNQKHKPIQVIDRDFYDNFRIDLFLKEHMADKNFINMIINKFGSIVKDDKISQAFKISLGTEDLMDACNVLFNLPYLVQRKFIVYLIVLRNVEREKEKEKELIRDKAA